MPLSCCLMQVQAENSFFLINYKENMGAFSFFLWTGESLIKIQRFKILLGNDTFCLLREEAGCVL